MRSDIAKEVLIDFDIRVAKNDLAMRELMYIFSTVLVAIVYLMLFGSGLLLIFESMFLMYASSGMSIFENVFSFGIIGGLFSIFLAHAIYFGSIDFLEKKQEKIREDRRNLKRNMIKMGRF